MSGPEGDSNIRIHAECSNLLSYQGQTFAVPCFWIFYVDIKKMGVCEALFVFFFSGFPQSHPKPKKLCSQTHANMKQNTVFGVTEITLGAASVLPHEHGWWTPLRRKGVRNDLCDCFASIFATGSQRWKGWDQSSREKKVVNLTYHWPMYVVIYPWNIIEFCRIFRRVIAPKKRQIVTFEVKILRNNRNKSMISNFDENPRQWWACVAGIYPYSYLVYLHVVRSPILSLVSKWFSHIINDIINVKMFRVRNLDKMFHIQHTLNLITCCESGNHVSSVTGNLSSTYHGTVKPVYNDHLMGYFSAFWSSFRWPLAT